MSSKKGNNIHHSNGYHSRNEAQHNHKRGDYEQHTQQNVHHNEPKDTSAEQKKSPEDLRDILGKVIDCEAARIGLTIADIFKTLTTAAASLPDMELDTDFMYLSINKDGIFVSIRLSEEKEQKAGHECHCKGDNDPGYDEYADEYDYDDYHDDEEEGMLYDGD